MNVKQQSRIEKPVFRIMMLVMALLLCGVSLLQAQDYPSKTINLVIPFGAGGASDVTARAFVHLSNELLGQPMIVQLKPGGGGAIGTEFVAQSKPDGYNALMGHANCNSILPAIEGRSKGPEEMEPVCRINIQNTVYYVRSDSPFKSIKDVIAYAKANPGRLSFGNSGTWSVTDLEWRWLEIKAGMQTRNVPHDGGGQQLLALLGGHIQVAMLATTFSLPHFKAGKLRPIAIQGPKRHPDFPGVPCMKEEGFDTGLDGLWKAVMLPKGTPRPIVDKLAGFFKKVSENKQVIESLHKMGDEFHYLGPDDFAKYWRKDYQVYKDMAKMFGK
jgi:tripartite-type tricarboxylate transporter receptor subunit TctC